MPLISLQIPPGVRVGGTDLESSGRWLDASLIRWRQGSMMPVGGWQQMGSVAAANPPRGALAWRDSSGDRRLAFGTADKLYVMLAAGTIHDITPVGLTAGSAGASTNTGFGGGFFGVGTFGTPRAPTGSLLPATTWSLDTWGQFLVGCSSDDGTLYEWQLNTATPAAAIANAPTGCVGLVSTEERFLFALGAGGNPRRVQWSDREDNTLWAAAATNQAGDIDLQTDGNIRCGLRTRGQTLILTDVDAHAATFLGGNAVYGFERVGEGCGVVGNLAAASTPSGVFWMGSNGFYRYAGGAVEPVPCEIHDKIFTEINRQQFSRVHAVPMRSRGEVWFFYAAATADISRYAIYNYVEGHWSLGALARTCGVDDQIFGSPLMLDAAGVVWEHEVGYTYSGAAAPYAESGPIQIGNGDGVMHATMLYPDERTQGQATVSFSTKFHPNSTRYDHGPYTLAAPTPVRFTGRQAAMRVTGTGDWRWGIPRLDAVQGGRR